MSLLNKKWLIKNSNPHKSAFEKILENRSQLDEIQDFHDPFLFRDMEKIVARIKKAIADHEKILVFGDYDVDGISGTAILVHVLRRLKADVNYRLPHRVNDGYGLSKKIIDEATGQNIKLIITVDCGISCAREIAQAKAQGIDTIITDHHAIPEQLPDLAFAILHPKKDLGYPFKELTGAGVALKLAHALLPHDIEHFLDLASLGTIADLGSLTGENRLIVKRGLKQLENTRWSGLQRIKELANLKPGDRIDTAKVGFQIAPRINAAGRIGDPHTSLKILLEENPELTMELEKLNRERQLLTETVLEEALRSVSDQEIIIVHHPDWHIGVLGLVAGKLVEQYGRPAIVMQDFEETLIASARSPEYFNMVEALSAVSDYLINFGGHARAAGFTLAKRNLENFKQKISRYAIEKLQNIELKPILEIDCELNQSELNSDLLEKIEELSPFGMGNQRPTFLLKNLEPCFIEQVGQDGRHLKFTVRLSSGSFKIIAFRMGQFINQLKSRSRIDLVCQLEKNHWNNQDRIELQALDFAFR